MGIFNSGCAVSGVPIMGGDRVVVLLLVRQKEYQHGPCYPTDLWAPAFLPIRGHYNEYGGLEDIDNTRSNRCAELFNCAVYQAPDTETLLNSAHDGKLAGKVSASSPMKVLIKEEIWEAVCASGAATSERSDLKKALFFLREAHKISPDFVGRVLNKGWDKKVLTVFMSLEGQENSAKLKQALEKAFPSDGNVRIQQALFPISQIFTSGVCSSDVFDAGFAAKLRQSVLTFTSPNMSTLLQESLAAHNGLNKINRLWSPALMGKQGIEIAPEVSRFNQLVASLSQSPKHQPW